MKNTFTIDEKWMVDLIDQNNEWLYNIYKDYIDWFFETQLTAIDLDAFITRVTTTESNEIECFPIAREDGFPVLMHHTEAMAVNSPHSIRDHLQTWDPNVLWIGQWSHVFYEYNGDKIWKMGVDVCLDDKDIDYSDLEFSVDKLKDFCIYFSVKFIPCTEANLIKYMYLNDKEFYQKEKETDLYDALLDEFSEIVVVVPNWKAVNELRDKRENPFQSWFDNNI